MSATVNNAFQSLMKDSFDRSNFINIQPFYRRNDMFFENILLFFESQKWNFLTSFEKSFHLRKNPWTTNRRTAYHYCIDAITVKAFGSPFRSRHIAVSDNRYMHARIVLYFTNHRPVGITFIHLSTRTTVNGQSRNTAILKSFCEFENDFTVLIPPETRFYSHRQINCFYYCRCNFKHLRNIAK